MRKKQFKILMNELDLIFTELMLMNDRQKSEQNYPRQVEIVTEEGKS